MSIWQWTPWFGWEWSVSTHSGMAQYGSTLHMNLRCPHIFNPLMLN